MTGASHSGDEETTIAAEPDLCGLGKHRNEGANARARRARLPRRAESEAGGSREMGAGGFEPPKAEPTGLQPVPFGRSGTPPGDGHCSRLPAGLLPERPRFRGGSSYGMGWRRRVVDDDDLDRLVLLDRVDGFDDEPAFAVAGNDHADPCRRLPRLPLPAEAVDRCLAVPTVAVRVRAHDGRPVAAGLVADAEGLAAVAERRSAAGGERIAAPPDEHRDVRVRDGTAPRVDERHR